MLGFPMGGAQFKTMQRKQNLVSALGIQKENLGVTMHFSDIIKLQFGRKRNTLLCILFIYFLE